MVAYLRPAHRKRFILTIYGPTREAEKEDSMELSQSPQSKATDNTAKPKVTSFFPLWKLKGTQPAVKTPTVQLAYLEEESAKRDKEEESEDPNGIDGVMEEFMVHLARAMKDTQMEEKHCYHCSSLEHFICNCPLVKALGSKVAFKPQGGDGTKEGSLGPSDKNDHGKTPQEEAPKVQGNACWLPSWILIPSIIGMGLRM